MLGWLWFINILRPKAFIMTANGMSEIPGKAQYIEGR